MDEEHLLVVRATPLTPTVHEELAVMTAALDALLAAEPLAPALATEALVCVYCWHSAIPRPGVPHPHSADCPWARARELRRGG